MTQARAAAASPGRYPRPVRRVALALSVGLVAGGLMGGCPSSGPVPDSPVVEAPEEIGRLTLHVWDEAGAAIEGATATSGPLGYEAASDAEGLVDFEGLPAGSYRITVAAEGYETTVVEGARVFLSRDFAMNVTLVADLAEETPALRVQARTAAGDPLRNAVVRVGGSFEATTDNRGVATLGGLPAGEQAVEILPVGNTPATSWAADLTFQEGAITLLDITLSGKPSRTATWVGSAACLECHEEEHDAWAASRHATTWSASPPADLEPLLAGGLSVAIPLPHATGSVQVELWRDGSVDKIRLVGLSDDVTYDLLGWIGVAQSVPVLDLRRGPAPGPVLWRSAGRGDLAPPAFEAGLRPFEPQNWFDASRELIDHEATDGPDPSAMEAAACLGCHAVGFRLYNHSDVVGAISTEGAEYGAAVERAVGCEACHGPGSEHVAAGEDDDGGVERIVNPGWLDPDAAMDVCAACHSEGTATASTALGAEVAFPYSEDGAWRPGADLALYLDPSPVFGPGGAAAGPNQQVDELQASPHGGSGLYALTCGECHTNHGPSGDVPHQLAADPDDNSLCLGCHESLNFPDAEAAAEHTRHSGYDPAGPHASGRCTGCHMPATASRTDHSEQTGGGRLASHHVAILPPRATLDAFDAAGTTALPLEDIPPNACLTCHRWAEIRYDALGADFHGPAGEPTQRGTYVTLSAIYDLLFGGEE